MIIFDVPGIPVPQGSKNVSRTGHTYEANKNLRPWRDSMIWAASQAHGAKPLLGPVLVWAVFSFPRPKSHYRTGGKAHLLRPSAPLVHHAQKPDLDKLQRALGDALVLAGVMRDDSQIAQWKPYKVWSNIPGESGCSVRIEELS